MANKTVTVKASAGDYTSLNAALSGESIDLVTNTRILTIDCYNFEDTTTWNTGTGYTTSASYYINLVAHDSHGGNYSTSAYRLNVNLNSAGYVGNNLASYTRFTGIQVQWNCTSGSPSYTHAILTGNGVQCVGVLFDRCILKYGNNAGTTQRNAGIWCGTSGSSVQIRNSLFISIKGGSNFSSGVDLAAGSWNVYNCTFYDCSIGVRHEPDSDSTATNCLMYGCASPAGITFYNRLTLTYCSTDSASFGTSVIEGAGCRKSQTFTFVGAEDFHLASNDAGALGYGTDLSGTFTTDIDGQTRPTGASTWDIGADEYVAAGGGTTDLTVVDGSSLGAGESAILFQEHVLASLDSHSVAVGENPALIQEQNLIAADGIVSSVGESLGLIQEHQLISVDGVSASIGESSDLIQEHNLSVSDGTSASVAESSDLVQNHNLTVSDGVSASIGESVALSTEGMDTLSVIDAVSYSVSDSVDLVQEHNLVSFDSVVAARGDSIDLLVAGEDLLTVSDSAISAVAETITLSEEQTLIVLDGKSASLVDELILFQEHILGTSDCYNPNHVDNVDLEIEHWLEISDGAVKSVADLVRIYSLILGTIIRPYILSVTPAWMVQSITTRRTIKQGEL
jgi:hypothetical protein